MGRNGIYRRIDCRLGECNRRYVAFPGRRNALHSKAFRAKSVRLWLENPPDLASTVVQQLGNSPKLATFSELTVGSTTESGYTDDVPFISSLITLVEEPRLGSSHASPRTRPARPRNLKKLGLSSGFLAIALSISSMFGVFGGLLGAQDFASAAELVGTSPGIGATLNGVPEQVIFGFDAPSRPLAPRSM
jgi:hypothetical protein